MRNLYAKEMLDLLEEYIRMYREGQIDRKTLYRMRFDMIDRYILLFRK